MADDTPYGSGHGYLCCHIEVKIGAQSPQPLQLICRRSRPGSLPRTRRVRGQTPVMCGCSLASVSPLPMRSLHCSPVAGQHRSRRLTECTSFGSWKSFPSGCLLNVVLSHHTLFGELRSVGTETARPLVSAWNGNMYGSLGACEKL